MEKENKEEGPSKSDKQEILILPPHWDYEDTELHEQFPHEFSIIRQFLDELVAKKQREEEWRSGFHQFCTLTRRWCKLYKAEIQQQHSPSPKSYKAEKQQLQQQHSLSPKSYKAGIQQLQQLSLSPKLYEAEMRGLFLNDKVTDEGKWFNDFLGFCIFIGKYYSVDEQEWLHRFHQFRSLRRSKDLDEVASDPVEKEWVYDFRRFCDFLMRRKMHTDASALAFFLLKIHFYPLTSIKVERKQEQLSAKEWLEDLDQFCSLFGAQVAKSKQKKLEWLDEFHQLLALFPENGDDDGVDWDQMEQLARAGPVFGNMQSAISDLDDIYAYFATEKSSSSRSSPALNYCRVDNADDASIALSPSTLHASLVFSNYVCDPKKVLDMVSQRNTPNDLQTLLFLGEYKHLIHQVPRELFLKLGRHLNVLDLSRTSITELPSSFANLRSLRYLDVSGTPITRLPNCICSFKDMQTLRLRDCYQLLSLPKDLSRLTKLRHLDMDTVSQLTSMPPGMRSLTELRTLPVFIVGKDKGCNIDEFTTLTALRGSVSILRLENADSLLMRRRFFDKKSFIEKICIEKLELEWTAGSADDVFKSFVVLGFLQPHINIKELRIFGYKGRSFATSWVGDPAYVNLKAVKLSNIRCLAVPRLGVLPQLQILHMSDFHDIQEIFYKSVPGSALYPRLNTLVLHSFPDLKDWVRIEDGDFPMLTHLKVSYCPKLRRLPELWLLSSLADMEISCCSELYHLLLISPEARRPPLQSLRIIDCPLLEKQYGGIEGMRRELDYIPDIVIME